MNGRFKVKENTTTINVPALAYIFIFQHEKTPVEIQGFLF